MVQAEPVTVPTFWSPADYEQLVTLASRRGMTTSEMAGYYSLAHLRSLSTHPELLDTFFRLLKQRTERNPSLLDPTQTDAIGSLRNGRLLLAPGPGISAARAEATKQGSQFNASVATLSRLMLERKLLVQTDGKAQALRRVAGVLRRVWSLPDDILD